MVISYSLLTSCLIQNTQHESITCSLRNCEIRVPLLPLPLLVSKARSINNLVSSLPDTLLYIKNYISVLHIFFKTGITLCTLFCNCFCFSTFYFNYRFHRKLPKMKKKYREVRGTFHPVSPKVTYSTNVVESLIRVNILYVLVCLCVCSCMQFCPTRRIT